MNIVGCGVGWGVCLVGGLGGVRGWGVGGWGVWGIGGLGAGDAYNDTNSILFHKQFRFIMDISIDLDIMILFSTTKSVVIVKVLCIRQALKIKHIIIQDFYDYQRTLC